MGAELTGIRLLEKAHRKNKSARVLLEIGDTDGACSRAYYAMFDAARAALLLSKAQIQPGSIKTHAGILSAFGMHLVKEGPFPKDTSRILKAALDLRIEADYMGDDISLDVAKEAVSAAETFVESVQNQFTL
jgi:uncharacterized protein (UPF0332 family)